MREPTTARELQHANFSVLVGRHTRTGDMLMVRWVPYFKPSCALPIGAGSSVNGDRAGQALSPRGRLLAGRRQLPLRKEHAAAPASCTAPTQASRGQRVGVPNCPCPGPAGSGLLSAGGTKQSHPLGRPWWEGPKAWEWWSCLTQACPEDPLSTVAGASGCPCKAAPPHFPACSSFCRRGAGDTTGLPRAFCCHHCYRPQLHAQSKGHTHPSPTAGKVTSAVHSSPPARLGALPEVVPVCVGPVPGSEGLPLFPAPATARGLGHMCQPAWQAPHTPSPHPLRAVPSGRRQPGRGGLGHPGTWPNRRVRAVLHEARDSLKGAWHGESLLAQPLSRLAEKAHLPGWVAGCPGPTSAGTYTQPLSL